MAVKAAAEEALRSIGLRPGWWWAAGAGVSNPNGSTVAVLVVLATAEAVVLAMVMVAVVMMVAVEDARCVEIALDLRYCRNRFRT